MHILSMPSILVICSGIQLHKVFLKVSKNFERFSSGQSKEDDIKEKEQQGDGGMKKCNKV